MSDLAIPKIECVESKGNFGRFLVAPLERGFGTTLGNVMRRVLLAYLPGAAVTQVRIEGLSHEFSPIPYVKEDTMEFLLNVKALRLKPLSAQPAKLVLEMQGERQVHASDIQLSTDFEIVNPELYLATLDSPEARLYVEFEVEIGIGYRTAESSDDLPVGTIPVDALFAPVRKVNFTIEPLHIGRETSQERLYLEVWTDGSISPEATIIQSADVLREQLMPFVDYGRVSPIDEEKRSLRVDIPEEQYNMTVEKLNLSVRAINCLRRANIATIGELVSRERKELLSLRNFGQKSIQELDERLALIGLSFSPEVEEIATQSVEIKEEKVGYVAGD
ncbi:MAG: DNA-directed RNA polymerase subunit alpha [Dehalococcoidales bacterium]|nr:DNA-directed RNA polymerase subunit alpha [Dehalococcoidales bacterium]MAH39102.1 DNA-directed RNA polymerase subunit alpha [Dehalococcoidales bacterium]